MAVLLQVLILMISSLQSYSQEIKFRPPSLLFQFGDSLSDTGNMVAAFPRFSRDIASAPYGMTFFGHASGRVSDGRILIDFLATALGIPLLEPYLRRSGNYSRGADFSTCGAPALSLDFLKKHGILPMSPTFALDRQLQWFLEFQKQRGDRYPDPTEYSKGLYVVGEIGGNDYGILRANGLSFKQIHHFVPLVVKAIVQHIRGLYAAGARNFLVINIPLQGCNPGIRGSPNDEKDEFGCMAEFNRLDAYHNSLLKAAVQDLRKELNAAIIFYADFHAVYTHVLRHHKSYGIPDPYLACCGTYTNSIRTTVLCGQTKVVNAVPIIGTACTNPSNFLYWNNGHFTDHFNGIVANEFLTSQRFVDPPLSTFLRDAQPSSSF